MESRVALADLTWGIVSGHQFGRKLEGSNLSDGKRDITDIYRS